MIREFFFILFFGIAFIESSYGLGEQDVMISPYKIQSVKGFLYYSNSGTFSENIIDNKQIPLWNITIEGSLPGGPADSLMIVVEISGHRGTFARRNIEFLAVTKNGRTVQHNIVEIGILSNKGKYFKAIMMNDIGCEALTFSVKITGQSPVSEVKKSIEFECGE